MKPKLTYILLMLIVTGCTFAVKAVKTDNITSAYKGQAMPAAMNLYLPDDVKSKVWEGHPSSFAGNVHTFKVPLGEVVVSATQKTFKNLFETLNIVNSETPANGAQGTIVPSIKIYSFRIDDMTLVSPGTLRSDIVLHFKILGNTGKTIWEEDVQGTGKKKQSLSAMLNPMGSWSSDLPVTTKLAVEDALKKVSDRIADSRQVREHLNLGDFQYAGSGAGGPKTRLYVHTTPDDSKIRILNIKPAYSPGIELSPGNYHLEISRKGYETIRKWVEVKSGADLEVTIDLTQQLAATKATANPTTNAVGVPPKPFVPQKSLFRQYWAVVVGVSRYSDSRIPSLRYADADAKYFYKWLISSGGGRYSPNNVKLLIDRDATGRNIKDALFNWLRHAIEEDVVIIYFAGHGSPDSPDTPDNLYLLAYDTVYDNIAATGFPMWDVETAIKRFIKAKRIIVIADACHSGGVGQSFDVARRSVRGIGVNPINARLEQLTNAGKGVAVISASGDRQTSQEGRQWGGGHGVFTYYLMQALKGEADYNQDKKVSLGELIPYLSEQVRRATESNQSPTVSGKFDPALTIAK